MKHIIRAVALVLVVSMLPVAAFAAEAVGSPVHKNPTIVAPQPTTPEEEPVVEVKLPDGTVAQVDDPEAVKVVPMDEAKEQTPEVKKEMEDTYTELADAKSLVEVAPEIADVMKELEVDTPAEDLVVRDLVKIELSDKLENALKGEGNYLEVSIEMDIDEDQALIVMVKNAEGKWVVLSADDVTVNSDGTVTLKLPCAGIVAFVVA